MSGWINCLRVGVVWQHWVLLSNYHPGCLSFISHLCYHAGEMSVEHICSAVKFIILILFCLKGILYEGKCGIFCWKGVSCFLKVTVKKLLKTLDQSTIHLKSFPKAKREGSTLNHTRSNVIMSTSAYFMHIGVAPFCEMEPRDYADMWYRLTDNKDKASGLLYMCHDSVKWDHGIFTLHLVMHFSPSDSTSSLDSEKRSTIDKGTATSVTFLWNDFKSHCGLW
jgi:hypothetical protein